MSVLTDNNCLRNEYHEFVSNLEGTEYAQLVNQAQVCQLRRKSSVSSQSSVHSCDSSTSSSASMPTAVPLPLEIQSAIHQKGFEKRQFEREAEFDQLLNCGFDADPACPTLYLTLTPKLVR